MGACIRACCMTETGLKCHFVISTLGLVYFTFMWLIFDRQKNFFEFHIVDSEGTKMVCLLSAIISLLFLVLILIQLMNLHQKKKKDPPRKKKLSIASVREMKSIRGRNDLSKEDSKEELMQN